METETKTTVGLRPCMNPTGKLSAWVRDENGTRTIAILSMVELQGLIQAAYDEHGMLAEPSIEVEISRVLSDEVPPETVDCGIRPCNMCSPAVRA